MNYKKKSLILSIILIISIQTLLLINNKQKTNFKYFIWNIQNVSIGRLIFISFFSGLLISFILNNTKNTNLAVYTKNKEDHKTNYEKDSLRDTEYNGSDEIPPERDLREVQPTISVNYRVVKDNSENESNRRSQKSKKIQYQEDWDVSDSEW